MTTKKSIRYLALPIALALGSATCTDMSGPGRARAVLGVAPSFSKQAAAIYRNLATFTLAVNNVHIVLTHENGDPAGDFVAPFGADSVVLELDVTLNGL